MVQKCKSKTKQGERCKHHGTIDGYCAVHFWIRRRKEKEKELRRGKK